MYVGACHVHVYVCLQHTNSVPLTSLYCPHLTHLVCLGRGKNINMAYISLLPLGLCTEWCSQSGRFTSGVKTLMASRVPTSPPPPSDIHVHVCKLCVCTWCVCVCVCTCVMFICAFMCVHNMHMLYLCVHILGLWEQGLGLIFLRYLVCVRGEGGREVLLLLEKLIHTLWHLTHV